MTPSWCAGVAFLPYAFYVLFAAPFTRSLGTAIAALTLTLAPLVVTDRLFYGKWAVSGLIMLLSRPTSRLNGVVWISMHASMLQ